ncbi:hypothetical protein [Candidatus Mycoplasma haematominutum]|uniref:Ca2+ / Na+ antiporter n=1 Tax=Candidatus Mycoplasma haematominutum 'Birmingham 1' TaxID=1116213 RepID=G8C2V5_9MOLU|nr:hypothetical protein [Candidatus Mycoplasma haematominutum]CCE66653.1 Ca2+ / Na+ antiporter [Candidatus Mycoplasma haematominutum 'Birmingham 1']
MLPSLFENSFLLLFFFLITSAGILYLSFLFTEAIKAVLSRFRLAENFVGSSLLAAGTSLAEAINAITAGIYDRVSEKESTEGVKYSLDSFYNLTGAISVQLVFLSLVAVIRKSRLAQTRNARQEYRAFTSAIFQDKITLWAISTVEIAILAICFIFPDISKNISIGAYNLIPLLFLILWIIYLLCAKKTNSETQVETVPNYTNIFEKYRNGQFLCLFSLIFFAFTALAFFNFNLVSNFEKVFSIPKNIGLGTLLSLITSFPEFASFTFLFLAKCYKTACAGFLGSALFNLVLPVLTQSIKGGWLFEPLSSDYSEQISIVIWLSSILLINLFFFRGFYSVESRSYVWNSRKENQVILWGGLVILTYILVACVIPIISKDNRAGVTQ